jgi:1,6-anhydro-N-acetylmuramate kinase
MRVIGLISGTSADAIEGVVCDISDDRSGAGRAADGRR